MEAKQFNFNPKHSNLSLAQPDFPENQKTLLDQAFLNRA